MKEDYKVIINGKDVIVDIKSNEVYVGTEKEGYSINKFSSKQDMFRVINILSQLEVKVIK